MSGVADALHAKVAISSWIQSRSCRFHSTFVMLTMNVIVSIQRQSRFLVGYLAEVVVDYSLLHRAFAGPARYY